MFAVASRTLPIAFALFVAGTVSSQEPLPPLPPPDEQPLKKMDLPQPNPQPGIRVAEKGPIHEAFAQPGADVRGKEMTAPKAPPPPINEVPPDVKPDGANVKWIPGYWQWDAGQNDFIWVSGFYRNVPPNRSWEPGKWIVKDDKNVYIPGYWRPSKPGELPNLPEPPKSVESGPSTPSGNPDAIWVPGGWDYRDGQFVWRSGYWASPYRHLMWQPPQYVYNGSDYNYVPGYWDYPLEERGLLNAPVYIDQSVYQNPNFTYTPQYGINVGDNSGEGTADSSGRCSSGRITITTITAITAPMDLAELPDSREVPAMAAVPALAAVPASVLATHSWAVSCPGGAVVPASTTPYGTTTAG